MNQWNNQSSPVISTTTIHVLNWGICVCEITSATGEKRILKKSNAIRAYTYSIIWIEPRRHGRSRIESHQGNEWEILWRFYEESCFFRILVGYECWYHDCTDLRKDMYADTIYIYMYPFVSLCIPSSVKDNIRKEMIGLLKKKQNKRLKRKQRQRQRKKPLKMDLMMSVKVKTKKKRRPKCQMLQRLQEIYLPFQRMNHSQTDWFQKEQRILNTLYVSIGGCPPHHRWKPGLRIMATSAGKVNLLVVFNIF